MLCYKDKTFCSRSIDDCVNTSCPDYFHMGEPIGDLPVSLADLKSDNCGFVEESTDE
jgi:hypothetical protein